MKKTGLLVLAFVLALGVLGVGYAAWSQTLNINGIVKSASFDVHFGTNTQLEPGAKGLTLDYISKDLIGIGFYYAKPGDGGTLDYSVANGSDIPVVLAFSYSLDGGATWHDWDGREVDIVKYPADTGAIAHMTMSNWGGFHTGQVMSTTQTSYGQLTFKMEGEGSYYAAGPAQNVIIRFVATQQ